MTEINRLWGMPNSDTFDCKPIGDFVRKYLSKSAISIDPFARNKRWATWTNDLNESTEAEYHMDSMGFLWWLFDKEVTADLVIFDPPYSPRQIKECYDSIGLKMGAKEALRTNWKEERDAINCILSPAGTVLSFGWNTAGMGLKRGFKIDEVLLVCHGAGHNDTICMAETRSRT